MTSYSSEDLTHQISLINEKESTFILWFLTYKVWNISFPDPLFISVFHF